MANVKNPILSQKDNKNMKIRRIYKKIYKKKINLYMKCKITGDELKPFMSFGKMPSANGFLERKRF